MFKPLLRTLPSLNGNVKIACDLLDYEKVTDKTNRATYIANVRGAKLLPLTSDKFQYIFKVNLLNSTYEYDIKSYYNYYKDIFYTSQYSFLKDDLQKLDLSSDVKFRNSDFEFGCKRISWMKNGQEYSFFAPIYCESEKDLPDYFLITVQLQHKDKKTNNVLYNIIKYIKVNVSNIAGVKSSGQYKSSNYLKDYLEDYYSKIDDKVGFCLPSTYQTSFFGIDVKNGGFTKIVDNKSGVIYNRHNTINNFDATICGAFQRNNIIMKQVLPLCYYFNIDNILSNDEKSIYAFSDVRITGKYYKDGLPVEFYDYETDYYNYYPYVKTLSADRTHMEWTNKKNVLDVESPSLKEKYYTKYQFTNKLSPWYCKWKLQQSHDEHPYVMNLSYAYSYAQDESYRYYTFPHPYKGTPCLVSLNTETGNESLYLPYAKYIDKYTSNNNNTVDNNNTSNNLKYLYNTFEAIMKRYYTDWFDVVKLEDKEEDTINNILNLSSWEDVINNKALYNGILYNFNNIYKSHENVPNITKFNVVLAANYVNTISLEPSKTDAESNMFDVESDNYIFSNSIIHKNEGRYVAENGITNPCYISDKDVYNDELAPNKLYRFDRNPENGSNIYTTPDDYDEDIVMKKADDVTDDSIDATGRYIDISPDFYDLNRWYNWSDVKEYINKLSALINDTQTITQTVDNILYSSVVAYEQIPLYNWALLKSNNDNENAAEAFENALKKSKHEYYIYDNALSSSNGNNYVKISGDQYSQSKYLFNINEKYKYIVYKKGTFVDSKTYLEFLNKLIDIAKNRGITGNDVEISKEKIEEMHSYYAYYPIYKRQNNIYGEEVMIRHNNNYGDFYGNHIKDSNYVNDDVLMSSVEEKTDALSTSTYTKIFSLAESSSFASLTNDNQGMLLVDAYNMENLLKNITVINKVDKVFGNMIHKELDEYTKEPDFKDGSWKVSTNTDSGEIRPSMSPKKAPTVQRPDIPSNITAAGLVNAFKDFNSMTAEEIKNIAVGIKDGYIKLEADGANLSIVTSKKDGIGTVHTSNVIKYDSVSELNDAVTKVFASNLTEYVKTDKNGNKIHSKSLSELATEYINSGYATESNIDRLIGSIGEKYINGVLVPSITVKELSYKYHMFAKFCNKEHLYVYCTRLYYPAGWQYIYRLHRTLTVIDGNVKIVDNYIPWLKVGTTYADFYNAYIKLTDKELEELVYFGEFYQVNEAIFDYIMQHKEEDGNSHGFTDLYLYYFEQKEDFNDPITFIELDNDEAEKEGTFMHALKYNKKTYDFPIKTAVSEFKQKGYLLDFGRIARPLFDNVYMQDKINTVIYQQTSLYKIKKVTIENAEGYTYNRYRYNMNDSVMLIEGDNKELYPRTNKNGFYRRYTLFDTAKIDTKPFDVTKYSNDKYDINIYDNLYVLTPKSTNKDKNIYGFYCMSTTLNNTFNYLNMVDSQYSKIRNVRYINDTNIVYDKSTYDDIQEFILKNIRTLLTCSNVNLYKLLYDINTLVIPQLYSFDTIYRPYAYKHKNVQILSNKDYSSTITLMRYFDDISPLITKRNKYDNLFMLKYKTVDKSVLKEAIYNETKDTPIYSKPCSIYDYPGICIQNSLKEYEDMNVLPMEYKYYNDNHLIYCIKSFSIKYGDGLTYDDLIGIQHSDKAFDMFCKYIDADNKSIKSRNLFLFKKYNIKYDSVCTGLNDEKTEKLYSLTLRFELL